MGGGDESLRRLFVSAKRQAAGLARAGSDQLRVNIQKSATVIPSGE